MKKCVQDMEGVNRLGCTAHTLQLVIGKGMKPAEILIARAKQLIDFFMRPKQSERLEEAQKSEHLGCRARAALCGAGVVRSLARSSAAR